MNKICGKIEDFSLVRDERSRYVVGYGLTATGVNDMYEWFEVYFYKKRDGKPTLEKVKDAIIADIDKQTDEKILNGYQFTPDGAEEPITVWLSRENQTNFSEAHRLHIVGKRFKLSETEDKQPIYHKFETFEELDRFYKGGVAYIQQCLQEGWQRKDDIDWEPYKALFPEAEPTPSES